MAENTAISWAHDTFNPWEGCTRISAACDHCYAAARAERFGHGELWAGKLRRTSADNWKLPLRWNREAAHWNGPRRVFCASIADVFDNQAPQAWRDDLWALIEATPLLTWMLLTKRPQNIARMVPPAWLINPPENVWYGATIENRATLAQRAHHLADVPAALRFWSCEPLLEDLGDVREWLERRRVFGIGGVHLIIGGGESGPKARPPHPDWFRSLLGQCAEMDAVFHLKQWGEWGFGSAPARCVEDGPGTFLQAVSITIDGKSYDGDRLHQFGDGTVMVRVGKKSAGRLLDSVLHDRMPGERHRDDCRICFTDLSNPSAAGGPNGLCRSCNEELPF
ncbi:MAG: phage Gp37/Gp68 family protein [Sphingomonas sp.]|nr:phage Gp37/Gp68 family protein [Sphingomonas sp.]